MGHFIHTRRETYQFRAEEARHMAAQIKNPENRDWWEKIAEEWERMAEDVSQEPN